MNGTRFDDDTACEKWGTFKDGYAVFYPQALEELCKTGGFSKKSFLSWANKGKILSHSNGANTKPTRINGTVCKCVWLKIEQISEQETDENGFIKVDEQMELLFD